MNNDFGVTTMARKHKRRKSRYIKGGAPWMGRHKTTRKRMARKVRQDNQIPVIAQIKAKSTPFQGKVAVASNRCGNECGRRAIKADYLCSRCRD